MKQHRFLIHCFSFGLFILFMYAPALLAQQWGLYTLYATKNGTQAFLIDTADSPVVYKTWTFNSAQKSVYSVYLTPGDTLVRSYKPATNTSWNTGPCHGGIQKITWDGTLVWDWNYFAAGAYCPHHDICPMPNGNVLLICYEQKSAAEATQAGSSTSAIFYSEKIIEVKPTGLNTGEIVWEWHLWDHLCQNYDAAKSNYVSSIVNNPQLMNVNYAGTGSLPDRYHMNGLDYNPVLNQIVFSMHFQNSVFIIDHSTTTLEAAGHSGGISGKGGDFLYRWGNPASYQASGTTIFSTVHDAHWVTSDHPSYPNYLAAYNNQGGTGGKTAIDIWQPPLQDTQYDLTPGSAYGPTTYTYRYNSLFTATNEGNSHQLPNGNMLVNNFQGAIYEVDPSGNVLWTKNSANSTHAYRYSLCYVRGPQVKLNASAQLVSPGSNVNLTSTVNSVTETNPNYSYSWTSNPAGFSSSLPNPQVTPTSTTSYILTVTNTALGCSASASIDIATTVNIRENRSQEILHFSPNPSRGIIEIQGKISDISTLYISDIQGRTMTKLPISKTIDITGLEDAVYIIGGRLNDGKQFTEKIILIK